MDRPSIALKRTGEGVYGFVADNRGITSIIFKTPLEAECWTRMNKPNEIRFSADVDISFVNRMVNGLNGQIGVLSISPFMFTHAFNTRRLQAKCLLLIIDNLTQDFSFVSSSIGMYTKPCTVVFHFSHTFTTNYPYPLNFTAFLRFLNNSHMVNRISTLKDGDPNVMYLKLAKFIRSQTSQKWIENVCTHNFT